MDISISKESLSHFLYLAANIVERRTTMPIISHVKLTAENDTLSVAATDLEITLVGRADAQVKAAGGITVNAKVLGDIVRELPEDVVNLLVTEGARLEIQCGASRFVINGTSPEEFPALRGISLSTPLSVDARKLFEMFEKTAFAVSTDESRHIINGVFVEMVPQLGLSGNPGIRFVATDGHRIAVIDRPADGLSVDHGVIIPRKGIYELKKVLEDNEGVAYVDIHDGFFTVQSDRVILGVRLIDGQFPDYRHSIPTQMTMKIELDRASFLSAVKRVSVVSTERSPAVKLRLFENSLVVSSFSLERGEASELIVLEYEGEGMSIGFNARYVLDVLTAMPTSNRVLIEFYGDEGPAIFSSNDDQLYRCLVMPMRFDSN